MRFATSLSELLEIRAAHADRLHRLPGCLGTAVGAKFSERSHRPERRGGELVPAIICFFAKKRPPGEIPEDELIDATLSAAGLTAHTDVVQGVPAPEEVDADAPLSAANARLVDRLANHDFGYIRGGLPISAARGRGTIACVVRPRAAPRELGLLTNWHVAGPPRTLLRRPAPPLYGLGHTAVSIRDVAGPSYHRIDGALVRLAAPFPPLQPGVQGLPALGPTYRLDLTQGLGPIGQRVVGVGQRLGKQTGTIVAFGYDWAADPATGRRRESTDYLIVGPRGRPFGAAGDSGKLVVLTSGPHAGSPVGLLWGGDQQGFWSALAQGTWNYASDLATVLDVIEADLWDGS